MVWRIRWKIVIRIRVRGNRGKTKKIKVGTKIRAKVTVKKAMQEFSAIREKRVIKNGLSHIKEVIYFKK